MTSSAKIPHVARLVQQTLRHMSRIEALVDAALREVPPLIPADAALNPLADGNKGLGQE